jgi:hypothetical protein
VFGEAFESSRFGGLGECVEISISIGASVIFNENPPIPA